MATKINTLFIKLASKALHKINIEINEFLCCTFDSNFICTVWKDDVIWSFVQKYPKQFSARTLEEDGTGGV